MNRLKPKEQHERLLASHDNAKIVQFLSNGQDQDVTLISLSLARQCDLFVHFERLWKMRVSGLDERLNSEEYMKHIYTNKRTLWKKLHPPAAH